MADCEGLDLSACICGYPVYMSERREGDEGEKEPCMNMKMMSSAATAHPHFISGMNFPIDTER